MNSRQKKVLESWRLILWEFVKREWFSLFVWTSLGVLAAESFDLLLRDHSFRCYLVSKFWPSVSFADPKHYVPYPVALKKRAVPVHEIIQKQLRDRVELDRGPEEPTSLRCENSVLTLKSAVGRKTFLLDELKD